MFYFPILAKVMVLFRKTTSLTVVVLYFQLFYLFVLSVAEQLLPGSRFHRYNRDGQSQVRSSAPYSVPDDIHQHLDFGKNCQVKYFLIGIVMIYLTVLIFVPSQLAVFIVSPVNCSRTSAEPISRGSSMASPQECTWEWLLQFWGPVITWHQLMWEKLRITARL